MSDLVLLWVALALVLALDLTTAVVSASFLNLSLAHLLAQRERDQAAVGRALQLLRFPKRLGAALDLAQSLWRVLFLILGYLLLLRQGLSAPWLVLGLVLLGLLGLLWLEWALRVMALRQPEAWALRLVRPAQGLVLIFTPLIALPLALAGAEDEAMQGAGELVADELKTLMDAGQQQGLLEQGESQMIRSIFELRQTLAREIMVPRIDMLALDVSTPVSEVADTVLRTGHTRIPVYQDTIDNVLGLLYAKDLLRVWREGREDVALKDLLRPAYFVPEAKRVDELLAEMQRERVHMALVVDEYGGIAGLVTLEDIVEEIVGEIQDEYDLAEEAPYLQLADDEYLFQGRVDLDDFNEVVGTRIIDEEADTLGGFIYSQMGRVPASGESIQVGDLLLTVEQVSGRRIRKVRVKRMTAVSPQNGEVNAHVNG